MDRNVTAWQWLMLIPQMLQPIGQWMLEAWRLESPRRAVPVRLDWVPPNRMMVDPNRELSALRDKGAIRFCQPVIGDPRAWRRPGARAGRPARRRRSLGRGRADLRYRSAQGLLCRGCARTTFWKEAH